MRQKGTTFSSEHNFPLMLSSIASDACRSVMTSLRWCCSFSTVAVTHGKVPVDSQVVETLRGHELGFVEVDDDAEVCAKVDEAQASVSEALAISERKGASRQYTGTP